MAEINVDFHCQREREESFVFCFSSSTLNQIVIFIYHCNMGVQQPFEERDMDPLVDQKKAVVSQGNFLTISMKDAIDCLFLN